MEHMDYMFLCPQADANILPLRGPRFGKTKNALSGAFCAIKRTRISSPYEGRGLAKQKTPFQALSVPPSGLEPLFGP